MIHKNALVTARRLAFIAALSGLIPVGWPQTASAQTPAGSVTSLQGQAQDQRAGGTINLAQGTQVLVGDKITTGAAADLTITLTDQSRLEVRESATITIDQHLVGPGGRTSTNIGLVSGLLRSFVHLTSSGTVPNFEVHTPNAIAAARATKYDTSYETGQSRPGNPSCTDFTDVSVYEGAVELRNAANPSAPGVMVPAGYTTTVPCALPPLLVAPLGTTGGGGLGGFTGVPPSVGGAPPPPPLPPPPPPSFPE